MNKALSLLLLLVCSFAYCVLPAADFAHHPDHGDHGDHGEHERAMGPLKFLKNKNQWEPAVHFRADIPGGQVFLLDQDFVFCYQNTEDMQQMLEDYHDADPEVQRDAAKLKIRQHAYRVHFANANKPKFVGKDVTEGYYNFFIGNDRTRWATRVPAFQAVAYEDLYAGIDMQTYSEEGYFKYDFYVRAGADASQIRMDYKSLDDIQLKEGKLVLQTSVNEVIEQQPYAYQVIDGETIEVLCEYVLTGQQVSFRFPNGYDAAYELVIDPVVVASTHSGSTVNLYGHTATYDLGGNIFSAGGGFSPGGLPITMGAFQATYGGGRDHCVNKYNPTGSALIFATYIGGSGNDLPHSMVTNTQGDLYVLGSTASTNFPTSTGAFQTSLGGGFSDISLTKIDPTGTILLGSTYLGGSGNDGTNNIYVNYGDTYRGEIIVDALDNVYVASMTESADFPTSGGAFQSGPGGGQDGILAKLNGTLSGLIFSTYIGGVGDDAAFGVVPDAQGGAYVTGSAASQIFTTPTGAAYPTYQGGTSDSYIAHFNNTATALINATFFGTTGNDYSFFIEADRDGDIYIFGQSNNNITATPGVYSGPSTGMFIAKFDDTLGVHLFTSTFGSTAPTAFLVDNCGYIYAAGHGGGVGPFDVSPNAIQATSAGFYLIVLEPNATALNYATYYGGPGSHVDGGTSRFDKRGFVYEATCTSFGFPTLPNAYSTTNQASGWDVTVFKIDFQVNTIVAQAAVSPSTIGCAPWNVNFVNTSVGQTFQWDFGDGSPTDTTFQPSHTYLNPGVYTVQLVAYDSTACVPYDTAYVQIQVVPDSVTSSMTDTVDCPTQTVFLSNTGTPGVSNTWTMGDGTTYNNLQNLSHTYAGPGSYTITLIVQDTLCNSADTSTTTILIAGTVLAAANVAPNNNGCAPFTANFLNTGNGNTYIWDFDDGSPVSNLATPTHTFVLPGTYNVMHYAIDSATCNIVDSLSITITVHPNPVAVVPPDFAICSGSVAQLSASGGTSYLWQPAAGMVPSNTVANPTVNLAATTTFTVIVSNAFGCADTANLTVFLSNLSIDAGPDQDLCIGSGGVQLSAIGPTGGIAPFSYLWSCNGSPGTCAIDSVNDDDPFVNPTVTTMYYVQVTDSIGCIATDSVLVNVYNVPAPGTYQDTILCDNATLLLAPVAPPSANFLWQDNSTSPTFNVTTPGLYWVQIYNVCDTVRDTTEVFYENSPTVDLGNDTIICPQDTLLLFPTVTGVNSYQWHDGSSDPFYSVTTPGLVTLIVGSPNCGTATDQVMVEEHIVPTADLGPDRVLCEGIPLILHTRQYQGATYLWQDGETVPSRGADQTGTYIVTTSMLCGDATDSVDIFFQPLPIADLGNDSTLCPGDTAFFSPGDFSTYLWQDGFTGPVYAATQAGIYYVQITDSVGCRANDQVEVVACEPDLFVPTAFSPNGDGLNDIWFPVEYLARVDDIRIFDRWGKLIFASRSAQDGWDGNFQGEASQEGAYTFVIGYVFPGGNRGRRAGTVTLLR